jgi:hypothetical protein
LVGLRERFAPAGIEGKQESQERSQAMKRTILLSTLAVVLLAGPALAGPYGTVELKETNVTPRITRNIYGPGFAGGVNAYVGKYNWALRNADLDVDNDGDVDGDDNPFGMQGIGDISTSGFCIEMQYSTGNYRQYSIIDLWDAPEIAGPGGQDMGVTKADYIRELWDAQYDSIGTSNTRAAAFQAAVWEIVYEDAQVWDVNAWDSDDLANNSSFKIAGDDDDSVVSLAQGWLDALQGIGGNRNLVAVSNDSYQDYVVEVPAPGAIVLGMMGLGLAGWVRKRIR